MNLTTADLDTMTGDERWGGWGYLGERSRTTLDTQAADARVIAQANALGWGYEALFAWANSKAGRWAGDNVFGGWPNGKLYMV